MPFELRYAGLDPVMEQRFRLATRALAAHRMDARAAEWDGTRCDVVAIDPNDAYGRRVLDIARRRGTPALEIGLATPIVESGATVARLTRALHELLLGASRGEAAAVEAQRRSATANAVVRLATDPSFAGVDLEARLQDLVVWLLPQSGRVIGATMSDLLRAREKIAQADWSLVPIGGRQRAKPPGDVATSLDAFLLQGAWLARTQLPPFPQHVVALRDWPDLGSASELVEALAVVGVLQRAPATAAEIARRCNLPDADVGACLWALRAAGLLSGHVAAPVQFTAPPGRAGGLIARLAAHFGLTRP